MWTNARTTIHKRQSEYFCTTNQRLRRPGSDLDIDDVSDMIGLNLLRRRAGCLDGLEYLLPRLFGAAKRHIEHPHPCFALNHSL